MKWLPILLLVAASASAASPTSINNDDSCDVRVGPAATLLLPYFEVDILGNSGQTTLFTVVNVTRYPQIAHVTLWTDWAYPVLTFNLYLTGYDVQAINLADILGRGIIAPPSGTSSTTTPGSLSASTNPNLRSPLDCASLPGALTQTILAAVRTAFTVGLSTEAHCLVGPTNAFVGNTHFNAIGYATIDVVASCTPRDPTDPLYYTNDLLFDNVLIGDYQQIGPYPSGLPQSGFDAAGNPMVHIRAVPEGGGAGSNVATDLPYTFYDRYTQGIRRTFDRRQPLPSTFAARFIQGGPAEFATNFTIWREGVTGSGASCASYRNNAVINTGTDEFVRFDEHDNPFIVRNCEFEDCGQERTLPATSSQNSASANFPIMSSADIGGWLYLNLNNGGSSSYSVTSHPSETTTPGPFSTPFGNPRASQNWVTVTMFGNVGPNRMTAEFDASPLGNGCSPAAATTDSGVPIGPSGGVFLCPPGTTLTDGTTALCKGTNVNPTP